ncbi:cell division ATP-binding protein FtsE [Cryobacterium melibiosiphilum]|uniref:Cell division ATP-binding protein FtsE n=1 Tax=Cryobacterium melibiosiphilum TaxID=995039 RepID=A0A3A5MHK6_9MICO|nr:cell division ATP-binding protein FtsE [Cryobacterium melibiosiphilum]RJT88331.1 cell division ATP-binding protein FtsE [Cryobacterium melibiosiphilum]
MIRFDHISKKYPGTTRPALNSIDVEILRGEFVFLVGASGSGKSSCLRLVLKEEKPTSGSIHVLGQDLRSISNRKVPYFRRNLGVVFQDFRLLPNKTVFDNVAFSLQVIGKSRGFIQEAVPDTLKMVGLAEKALRFPHELSGGEQQRVAIARAIVNKPQILLADEPTGNLDPTTSAGIMALLASINAGGTTVIMATHEAGIVDEMQRRVIELVNGEIVRDERQGGYATAAIPTVTAAAQTNATRVEAAARQAEVPVPLAAPVAHPVRVGAGATGQSLTFPSPIERVPATEPAVEPPAAPVVVTAPDSGMPVTRFAPVRDAQPAPIVAEPPASAPTPETSAADAADPATTVTSAVQSDTDPESTGGGPVMARPVVPATPHDAADQLTLAEKLGLRAPGEKPDTGEQNVGPTR